MYTLREKIAYSFIGKQIAIVLQKHLYKKSRVHWIQQSFAELSSRNLIK